MIRVEVTAVRALSQMWAFPVNVEPAAPQTLSRATSHLRGRPARPYVLDVENSSVAGPFRANGAQSIRICGDTTSSINISGSTGFVLVGDPGEDGCAPNVIGGSLKLNNNTGGLVAGDNTITGALTASANRGAGPFPDQTTPIISGNHH